MSDTSVALPAAGEATPAAPPSAPTIPTSASTADGLSGAGLIGLGVAAIVKAPSGHAGQLYLIGGAVCILAGAFWQWANATKRMPAPLVAAITLAAKAMANG